VQAQIVCRTSTFAMSLLAESFEPADLIVNTLCD
jgi:hypothetical protein